MKLTDREKDLLNALTETTKSALSLVPAVGQAIAGYDAYHRSQFERNLVKVIDHLQSKVENIEVLFSSEWLKTEDGQQFSWKVLDSAYDSQLEDKQELFVNALINGINKDDIPYLEKLKFVDMLRHLSRFSLMVLSEMHIMFSPQTRGPGRSPDPISSLAIVKAEDIADQLSEKYNPYAVVASVQELASQGLFSKTGEWFKDKDGKYIQGRGFSTEMCYTDYSARFVEFIYIEALNESSL